MLTHSLNAISPFPAVQIHIALLGLVTENLSSELDFLETRIAHHRLHRLHGPSLGAESPVARRRLALG